VYPTKLEKYHEFSGSKSDYKTVKRRFKSEQKKRFEEWEAKGWIVPGWKIERNNEGEEVVSGLKAGEAVRIRSALEIPVLIDSPEDIARGDDEAIQERLNAFADSFGAERPAPRKKRG
jgi:hypothetical protein